MKRAVFVIVCVVALVSWVPKVSAQSESEPSGIYKGYPGPERPDSEIATLLLPDEHWLIFRNDESSPTGATRVGDIYTEVKIPPGENDISWGKTYTQPHASFCLREVVMLEAGHVYLIGTKRHRGGLMPESAHMWIEDTVTHEIISGRKPRRSLLPGQVNPPHSFRTEVAHNWFDECFNLEQSWKHPEVLRRRQMIIELGDKYLASPIVSTTGLRIVLTWIAEANEQIEASGCPETPVPRASKVRSPCDVIRYQLREFIRRVEAKGRKGKLSKESAADLIATAQSILSCFEKSPEVDP
jgi:hypothetical protein